MSAANTDSEQHCTVRRYTPAWEVGTGLRVSLAPGRYRITGREHLAGVEYYALDNVFRVDVRQLEP